LKGKKDTGRIKRIIDISMTLVLLCLMAYQVTGEAAHEFIGVGMTLLCIVHQILNRRWYGTLLKGKYKAFRVLQTGINILLIMSFAVTAFCGMSMSTYAVPFMYGILRVSLVRRVHLSMSHWSFVLMGLHLGLHVPVMTARLKLTDKIRTVLAPVLCGLAGIGLFLFLHTGMPGYLFFRVAFAFLDYDKAPLMVFLENILMLLFWTFAGAQASVFFRNQQAKKKEKRGLILPVLFTAVSVVIGSALGMAFPSENDFGFGSEDWTSVQEMPEDNTVTDSQVTGEVPEETEFSEAESGEDPAGSADAEKSPSDVQDGFILIEGGSFSMGSPETENWRIDDETQHEVTVSSFYADPFETTQEEYERLMGDNPSTFKGEGLPVENISWLDAAAFANAKSLDAGLMPAYTIKEGEVIWDRSADGYRLPTEAEWEYACRAGTETPFNMLPSPDADHANFYGHYPYEIEENYFDNSALESKPGTYRQTTVEAGSFEPNAWGLYDCHGNVNEWCFDFYGPYDPDDAADPAGPSSGTRHVYRGGGWNDFAKNMRSAYRAAGQARMKSFNLGLRLVRNAEESVNGTVTAREEDLAEKTGGKVLIAFFSWSGNTRGIAQEIQRQTGADLFEITPVHPYSSDYNTVLMEAQEDQHNKARPELSAHVENMEDYDTILLGYPNWWASIPMPVASFLEEYDFSGKRILPFCSHGGGRFGQSLTAIAKLAPDADLGEGLSVHYSGGASLSEDVSEWLSESGIDLK
jgi:formylglycine-generating enzyme required for sulfatase activity/flavodoxin